MGYYINKISTGEKLPASGKVQALIDDGAEIVNPVFSENLICVVDNGEFEAAGYCYDEKQFERFSYDDGRPKTWLVHPQAKELAD
jgi:hypothetical protein